MPREHIEFIQAQMLDWSRLKPFAGAPEIASKILSRDSETGAQSGILRYPENWRCDQALCLRCDEELFVLDGTLYIGDVRYEAADYAFLPAGYPRASMHTETGCVVLTFYESTFACETDRSESYDTGSLIERIQTNKMPWSSASDRTVAADAVGRKLLRPDTPSGDRTWLLNIVTDDGGRFEINGVERHPCVEEMFLIDGDIAMTTGTLRSGAYFWRPPGIAHGPMGTVSGFQGFFRAKEGRFSTEWSEPDGEIPWGAEYRPILPANLRKSLRNDYEPSLKFQAGCF